MWRERGRDRERKEGEREEGEREEGIDKQDLAVQPRQMGWNWQLSCLSLLGAGITDMEPCASSVFPFE